MEDPKWVDGQKSILEQKSMSMEEEKDTSTDGVCLKGNPEANFTHTGVCLCGNPVYLKEEKDMWECNHLSFVKDKAKDFAYCEECLMCWKNGEWITKEEYIQKYGKK